VEGIAFAVVAACAVVAFLQTVRSLASPSVPLTIAVPSGSATHKISRARRIVRGLGRRAWLQRLSGMRPTDDATAELVGAAAVLAVVPCVALLLSPSPGPLLAPVPAAVALRGPRISRARAVARRAAEIDAELPQFLDALAAASTAGLSAPLAVRRATGVVRGALHDELMSVVRASDLGSRWRDELRALAERTDLLDLRRAVSVLTRTETLGASLSTSTVELAERVRSARRQRMTERARTAPVKMLFPLVFLVLPAFLLLTVVPVLLTTIQSIR
jgi:pilus assembly protein TadC